MSGRAFRAFGESGAEDVISDAMEAISILLNQIEKGFARTDYAAVQVRALSLISSAQKIGLGSMARVAADVADCAERGDPVSLSATLARLTRLCDRSILAVWDVQDVTV